MINLPRLSLRLRLSLSITAIVALFTLTNITYQVSSQNRNLRLDNLQNAVQGQLASVNIRQSLENQQKEILVLDALMQSGEEKLTPIEIENGVLNLNEIATAVNNLKRYAYTDAIESYRALANSHQELSDLWKQFYTGYNSEKTPQVSVIEKKYALTVELLSVFEALEIQAAEQQTSKLQTSSRFTDRVTLGIYLFTIALTVSLGYLLIRYTIRSLKDLNMGTVRIGRGDLDYHIPIGSDDEIGDLTIAFNDMADKLRNAMAQVQQSKEKADQANRAKTNFLANMSHELRTPLNAIIGYSEMNIELFREDNTLDEEQTANDLQHILNSGRHLLQLINDVLDLAKIESGNMTVFNETFDSLEIIQELVTIMNPLAKKRNNVLIVEASSEIPKLNSDAVKFRQVFLNLLSNACKFTENGKISILITHNTTSGQLIYHVSDTGIGMSPTQLEYIFEAFVQADSNTSKNYGGTGLGLAICKEFIELMKGTLDVSSADGEGTTFTIVLPVKIKEKRKAQVIPTRNQQELGLTTNETPIDTHEHSLPNSSEESPSSNQNDILHITNLSNHPTSAINNSFSHLNFNIVSNETFGEILENPDKTVPELSVVVMPPLQKQQISAEENDGTTLSTSWKSLIDLIPKTKKCNVPILAIFSPNLQKLEKFSHQSIEFNALNRIRLVTQIRRHNPKHRRGNALLIEFNSNNHTSSQLEKSLIADAWQCHHVNTPEHACKKLLEQKPEIICIDSLVPASEIEPIFQILSQNIDSHFSSTRIYLTNFNEDFDQRSLDQLVIEIIILAC